MIGQLLNIKKLGKMLIMMLSVFFLLTACSTENDEAKGTAAVSSDVDVNELSTEHAQCWQKEIFELFYGDLGKMALNMYSKITDGALALMMVAFAVWLTFRMLKHVSSFSEENMAEVWNEILRKLFICFVCGLLASSSTFLIWVLYSVIFPVFNAFLELANAMLPSVKGSVDNSDKVIIFGQQYAFSQSISCKARDLAVAVKDGTIPTSFPDGPKEMMGCMICAINDRMSAGMSMAWDMVKLTSLSRLIVGLFLLACFFIVKLGFVFYLVDMIFKMTIAVIMLPIVIMGYAFQKTKSWLGFVITTILASAAFVMFLGVVVAMVLAAMVQIINDNADIFADTWNTNWSDLSVPMLCLVLVGFLVAASLEMTQVISSSLVGGGGDEFQKKLKALVQMGTEKVKKATGISKK